MKPVITFFVFAFALVLLASLIRSLNHRRSAGAVLTDAGPNPTRGKNLFTGFFCLLLCVWGLIEFLREFDLFYLSFTIAGAACVIALIANALGRLQILENGLWLYSDLIVWERIAAHRWDGENNCQLRLQIKTLPFVKKETAPLPPLIVPAEFRTPFEEELQKHATSQK